MPTGDLAAAAAFFGRAMHDAEWAQTVGLEKAAVIVETAAKAAIGTYEYGWPQLTESTQADRVRKGFSPNDPLRRSGSFADSISHVVEGKEAQIGTNDKGGKWFELGTSRMAPRPVLVPSVIRNEAEIKEAIGRAFVHALSGRGVP